MSRDDDWEERYWEEWEQQQYEWGAEEYWGDYYYEMMMVEIANDQYAVPCGGAIFADYDVPSPYDC